MDVREAVLRDIRSCTALPRHASDDRVWTLRRCGLSLGVHARPVPVYGRDALEEGLWCVDILPVVSRTRA
jgi:hypothetical protein